MATHRALLLDDSEVIHARVRRAFTGTCVSVETTSSWVDAKTALFSSERPHVLILDLQMPTIDGLAVARAIRRRVDVPVVIYSSESRARLDASVRDVGAAAAVSKSAPDGDLVAAVMKAIAEKPSGNLQERFTSLMRA